MDFSSDDELENGWESSPSASSSESEPARNEFIRPSLKIKLKLPSHRSHSSAGSTPNPDDRHSTQRRAPTHDPEFEDDDDEVEGNSRSTPSTVAGPSTRPMTARQAVLASGADASHVSLTPSEPSRKKKLLNDAELVLRREETARKRRNLTEKRLEDEKAETINRLLKKQSRQRSKRALNEPSVPGASVTVTPDPEALEHSGDEIERPEEPVVPKMYRWISSARTFDGDKGGEKIRKSVITFAVPVNVIDAAAAPDGPASATWRLGSGRLAQLPCDVAGCGRLRKYRLTTDLQKGACGMQHLKVLENLPT